MVAGEDAGDDVRSEDGGEDIRWTHPDALRAAVLTANGVRARARWETKQGIDYATFRFALKDASGAKLRRAPSPPVDGARERSPSRASRVSPRAFDTPGRDAGQTRRGFEPALLVVDTHAGPVDAENAKTATLRREEKPRRASRLEPRLRTRRRAFEARARPSGRQRFHPRGARGERRREKRSAGRRVPAGRGARRLARRRGTKKKKRRARRGRRLVHRGRPAGHRVRSGGRARVEPVCRCIERRRRRRFRDLALFPRRRVRRRRTLRVPVGGNRRNRRA